MVEDILKLHFRLYVAGSGLLSSTAKRNLARIAARARFEYDIEVIDVLKDARSARAASVMVTPALVKLYPPPRTMIIGDLADEERVLKALQIRRGSDGGD